MHLGSRGTKIVEHFSLKQPLIVAHKGNRTRGTKLERGAFALVVTSTNELQLFLPATSDEDAVFPQYALALIAVANKFQDKSWVERLLIEEFGPGQHYN